LNMFIVNLEMLSRQMRKQPEELLISCFSLTKDIILVK
jgi:hypothetical protein